MSAPLATPSDLCTRLGIDLPAPESEGFGQLEALLQDASSEIEAVIGQPLAKMTSIVTLFPDSWSGRNTYIDLPARPVHTVDSVFIGTDELNPGSYSLRNLTLILPWLNPDVSVEVEFTHGYDPLPEELRKWTCILASGALRATETTGALGITAGISQHSETIDDYTQSWANYTGNKAPGMTLPPDVEARLRSTYGMGGISTVKHR